MPITPPGAAAVIAPNLLAVGMLGTAMPQFALGVGTGLSLWAPTVTVTSIDVGTLGVGTGLGPVLIPPPLLLANLLISFTATGIMGVMAPLKALGLSNGISLALAQGVVQTINPIIGAGAGIAKFIPPPAIPQMIAGFAAVGMTGTSIVQMATAIGMALMQTFAVYVTPIVIVGAGSPTAGGGIGSGSIV